MSERIKNVDHAQRPKEYNGKKFRSDLERNTARTLDVLNIPYEYEPRKIVLLEGFRCPYQKDKVRALTYTPDFIIGNIMIECKGFETPEWKNKKKLVFRYLIDNEPDTMFYQIHDCKKSLLTVLDNHWITLGKVIKVTSKSTKKNPSVEYKFSSIREAMDTLHLTGRTIAPIMRSLMGNAQFVYDYNWKLENLNL